MQISGGRERARVSSVVMLATMAGGALGVGLLGGCTGPGGLEWGPLGSRAGDRGSLLPAERLRRASPLNLADFKGEPVPAPEQLIPASVVRAAMVRAGQVERLELPIERVRAAVLENNLQLKVALRDPAIASESLRAEMAKFESVLNLAVRGQRDDLPTLNVTTPNQRDSASGSAGVDIPLRTGGRVSVDLTESWSQTPNPFVSLDESFSSGLGVSISQPLLRNAGERVNTASIAIAGYNQQIAEARTTNRVIAEIASGERAYWRVYAAARELEVRQKQYELAVEQLERARRRVSAGQSPEVEVTRAESGVAGQLEAIIVAENTLLDQQRELKRRMNLPEADIAGTTLISPATQPNPLRYDLTGSKEQLCDAALVNRAELLEAELAVLADAVNVDVARNATLPDVSLSGSYELVGLDRTFWLSQRRLSNANNDTWNAGVTAAIPLGNEAAEARLRRAIITRVQSIADKAAREQTVRQEVLGAIDRMNSGWQRILAARQNALLAARTLAAEQRQFDVGSRTSTDVLDAATRLADAQSAEIRALADYEVAKIDLAVATGTVLGASAVGWEARGE